MRAVTPIASRPAAAFVTAFSAAFVATAVVATPLRAQRTPPWQVLREMEVTGTDFDRDDVAGLLAYDSATVRRLQQGLDDDSASEIAERVATMHHNGGYHTATASGTIVDGHLHIDVQPGPRRRWRAVRCVGNTARTDAELTTALTTPPGSRPGGAVGLAERAPLPIGEFANTTPSYLDGLRKAVQAAYEDVGRYGTDLHVATALADDGLDLVVTIVEEGREVRIADVQLDGEPDEDTAAAVLTWAAPPPGSLATREVRERLREHIEATARYSEVEVAVASPSEADDGAMTLKVHVAPVPDPLPFDPTKQADAGRLDHALQGTVRRLRDGATLRLTAVLEEAFEWPQLVVLHPGRVEFALGTQGVHLEAESVAWGGGPRERFALQLVPEGLQLVLGPRRDVLATATGSLLSIQFQITSDFSADGRSEFRWGIGASTKAGNEFVSALHPSFARKLLTNVDETRHDGDDLVLRIGETQIRLGPGGEVQDEPIHFDARDVAFTASILPRLPDLAAAEANDPGALRHLLVTIAGQSAPHPTDRDSIEAMLDAVIAAWPALPVATRKDKPSLTEAPGAPSSFPLLVGGLVQQPCVRRSYSGSMLEACAAVGGYVHGDPQTARAALDALVEQRRAGPLLLAPLAHVFRFLGNERYADVLLQLARQRWSFEQVWDDAADLLANAPSLADVPARAGAGFRAAPALSLLFPELPDGPEGDRRAFRIGVRYWWSHGGESLLKNLLLR